MKATLPSRRIPALVACAALVLACTAFIWPDLAQDDTYRWSGRIPAGASLRVYTVHGTVTVTQSRDGTARVVGTRRRTAPGSDLSDLRFAMRRDGDHVIVCGLYDGISECGAGGIRTRGSSGRRRVRADFTVELPRGTEVHASSGNGEVEVSGATTRVRASSGNGEVRVGPGATRVDASSGNGDVTVEGAGAPVKASSGNGRVTVSTSVGPVDASTGNGNVDVRIASLRSAESMAFSSGNGNVTLTLPASFSARVEASTGHGGFESDFPIQLQGRVGQGRYHGTIGRGGPLLRVSTGNGTIRLRRAGS